MIYIITERELHEACERSGRGEPEPYDLMKTTIRIIYEHSVSTQETFNLEQLQWASSEIIKLMASGASPRITGFSVQHGEDRKEFFSHPENVKKGSE